MTPEWAAVTVTVIGLVLSAIGNGILMAFVMGKKNGEIKGELAVITATINGRFDAMEDENEHCRRDRHGMRDIMQLQGNDLREHGQQLAVLNDRRRHRESDDE